MKRSLIVVLALLTTLSLAATSFAGDTVREIARPTAGGSSIQWQANASGVDHYQLIVTTPNHESFTREFAAGTPPSFRLQDMAGKSLMDGPYHYELRAIPQISASIRQQLADARANNDDEAIHRIITAAGLGNPVAQSGTFTVVNGSILDPSVQEPAAREPQRPVASNGSAAPVSGNASHPSLTPVVTDNVIADDLIVQGSACVGLDCVNGESFGFDTIRLKENNTRINFDDTSTSAGFANVDWTLTANDSASGGANRFSIDDVTNSKTILNIEAASPSNSIYIDSSGKIGFRNSNPGLDLHMTTGDTPAIRFEQTNSSGFTAQTWDIGANEANWFVRDLTGGSKLSLRIRPGAPTSSIDIAASGSVGVGTASPEAKLHVFGTSTADTFIGLGNDPDGSTGTESAVNFGLAGNSFGRGAGFMNTRPDSNAVAPNPSLRFATGNTVRMIIDNEGFIGIGSAATGNPDAPIQYTNGSSNARLTTAGVWQDASSRKAKENIVELPAEEAVKALQGLNPVKYDYKVLPTDQKVGFIAEDVPDLVATPERDGLSAMDIVAVVTRVVKEQQKTIEQLNERIGQLEKEKQK
jgi:hypothetical protein